MHGFPQFQRSIFYYASTGTWIPLQGIGPTQHRKVRQADFIWIAVDDGWHSEVVCFYRLMTDLKLKVAAIIKLRPLQLAIVLNQIIARIVSFGQSNILAIRRWRRDCCPSKFNSNAAASCRGIVRVLIEPNEVADPICMGIARDNDVVANVVFVKSLKCSVSVRLIAILAIVQISVSRPPP